MDELTKQDLIEVSGKYGMALYEAAMWEQLAYKMKEMYTKELKTSSILMGVCFGCGFVMHRQYLWIKNQKKELNELKEKCNIE